MTLIQVIDEFCFNTQTKLLPQEKEEILFLLENDVSIFHLSKINLEEAIQEAVFYITPDF